MDKNYFVCNRGKSIAKGIWKKFRYNQTNLPTLHWSMECSISDFNSCLPNYIKQPLHTELYCLHITERHTSKPGFLRIAET